MCDEIFSAAPPIPVSKRGKTPPPETTTESKPKRKYMRRAVAPAKPADIPAAELPATSSDEALAAAEGLFDDEQLLGYYTIDAFIRLFNMVKPEDHRELAKIIEGLVSNPKPTTK